MKNGNRIRSLLERSSVSWKRFEHAEAHDPEESAIAGHVRARRLAAATIVRDDHERPVMLILPASEHLDLDTARRVVGGDHVTRASRRDVAGLFPDCDPGALPPFGRLYGVPAVLDRCFFENDGDEEAEIYFEPGNHRELVAMRFADFRRLAGPFAHEACLHRRQDASHVVKHGGRGALT